MHLNQQQVIRITVKCLRQHDTHLFLTAQFPHQHIVLVFLYAQSAQQRSSITLGIPTIQFGKLLFQFRNFQAIFTCKQTARLMSIFTWDDEKMKVLRMVSNRIVDRENGKEIIKTLDSLFKQDDARKILGITNQW